MHPHPRIHRRVGSILTLGLLGAVAAGAAFTVAEAARLPDSLMKALNGHGWAFVSEGGCARAKTLWHSEVAKNDTDLPELLLWRMDRKLRIETDKDGDEVASIYHTLKVEGDKVFLARNDEEEDRLIVRVLSHDELWWIASNKGDDPETAKWSPLERCCKNGKVLEKCT